MQPVELMLIRTSRFCRFLTIVPHPQLLTEIATHCLFPQTSYLLKLYSLSSSLCGFACDSDREPVNKIKDSWDVNSVHFIRLKASLTPLKISTIINSYYDTTTRAKLADSCYWIGALYDDCGYHIRVFRAQHICSKGWGVIVCGWGKYLGDSRFISWAVFFEGKDQADRQKFRHHLGTECS